MTFMKALYIACCILLISVDLALAGSITVDDGLTREFTVEPGGKAEGRIVLRNSGNVPQQVRVYQTDYLFYCNGKNEYGDPGSVPRSNCTWIAVAPRQLIVPAKDTASIYYTIQVPEDKALSGTYWSALMVEPLAESALEPPKTEKGEVTMGVQTVMRYAIQFVTNLGRSGTADIKLIDKQIVSRDGRRLLQLDIENTGEKWLRPSVRAEVYSAQGTHIGRFEAGRCRIYPECSVRQYVDLTSLKPGRYSTLVVIDNGDESVWGAQYELEAK